MWDWFHLVWVVCQSEGERNDSKLFTLPSVGPTWLHTLSLSPAFLFSTWAPKLLHILAVTATPTVHGHTSWTLTTTPDTFSSCTNVSEIKAMQSASLFPGPSQLSVACSIFVHESLGTRLAKCMIVHFHWPALACDAGTSSVVLPADTFYGLCCDQATNMNMWCWYFLSCITSWYVLWFVLWSGNQYEHVMLVLPQLYYQLICSMVCVVIRQPICKCV